MWGSRKNKLRRAEVASSWLDVPLLLFSAAMDQKLNGGFDSGYEAARRRWRSVSIIHVPSFFVFIHFWTWFSKTIPLLPFLKVKSRLTDELRGWICLIRRNGRRPTSLNSVWRSDGRPSLASSLFSLIAPWFEDSSRRMFVSVWWEPTWTFAAERAAGTRSKKKPNRSDPPPGAERKWL